MKAAIETTTSTAPASGGRPARRKPTAAHRAEYAALRATLGALAKLPWSRASNVGARLGLLGFRPLGIRRDVVVRQIADSFPELDAAGVERIARGAYESLGRTTVEAGVLPSLGPGGVLDLFAECEGWDVVQEAGADGRGIIFVAGHFGNWELGGAYIAARGIPLDAIVRGQGNPLFDAYITETRTRLGMTVVHDSEAVRRTPRSIKTGRSVAFLMDQGVLGLASTWVPFFGRPAKTPRGPAVFALRLDAPIVFAAPLRRPDNRFRMVFERVPVEVTGDRERDVDGIVASYTRVLEKWVRRVPEQYFWHHRRWKHAPPADWSGGEGA
ncbi:MAG TPA: lysophospholipid acyltransferase family protein [Gemmatimonadales bacterium]